MAIHYFNDSTGEEPAPQVLAPPGPNYFAGDQAAPQVPEAHSQDDFEAHDEPTLQVLAPPLAQDFETPVESTPQVLAVHLEAHPDVPQVLAPPQGNRFEARAGSAPQVLVAPIEDDFDVEDEAWRGPRGTVTRSDGKVCIGRVGAPSGHEATHDEFWFWVPPDAVVEQTQIVTCESRMAGRDFIFYAVIEEVRRASRSRDMGREMDASDGDLLFEPPSIPKAAPTPAPPSCAPSLT